MGSSSADRDSSFHSDFDAEKLDALADDFIARIRRGESPSVEGYVEEFHELADRIRDLFPMLADLEGLKEASDAGSAVESPAEMPERIGEYRIFREIGRGGMGVVYEAEQVALGRRVALKVLPQSAARSHNARERFQREAKAAAGLHHTNIVPVFDVGSVDGYDFYAMQYIAGHALDQVTEELRQLREMRSSVGSRVSPRGTDSANDSPRADAASPPVANDAVARAADTAHPNGDRTALVPRFLARSVQSGRFGRVPLAEGGGTAAIVASPADVTSPSEPEVTRPLSETASGFPAGASTDVGSSTGTGRSFYRSVARLGARVAHALEYAHQRGIVHRDIKPANLLLDTTGEIWVTDFGLAKVDESDLTQTGDVVGTLRYMSPERFSGTCDATSDIYSLGVTLYELLTLRPAFDERDRMALIDSIHQSHPTRPRTVDARIPSDLETVVLKAMAKEPRDRYASASELASDLECVLHDLPIRARRVSPLERCVRWSRRNPALATSLFGIFVLLVGISGVFAVGQRNERQQRRISLRHLYNAEMTLAGIATKSSTGSAEVRRMVEGWTPEAAGWDFRGWEWFFFEGFGNEEVAARKFGASLPCVVWAPDDASLIVGDAGGTAHVLDPASLETLATWQLPDAVRAIDVHPDRRRVLTVSHWGTIQVHAIGSWELLATYDIADFEPSLERKHGQVKVLSADWHPNGVWVALGFFNRGPIVIDLSNHPTLVAELDATGAAQFDPTGKWIAANTAIERQSLVGVWETGTWDTGSGDWQLVKKLLRPRHDLPGSPVWSPDGTQLAAGSLRRGYFWSLDEPERGIPTMARSGPMSPESGETSLAWCPDGRVIAGGGRSQVVRIWDPTDGRELRRFSGHLAWFNQLAWAEDAKRLVSVSDQGWLRMWDWGSHPPVRELRVSKGVHSVGPWLLWSEDSRHLASVWSGNSIFDTDTGERYRDAFPGGSCTNATGDGFIVARDDDRVVFTAFDGRSLPSRKLGQLVNWVGWAGPSGGVVALTNGEGKKRPGDTPAELWRFDPHGSDAPERIAEGLPHEPKIAADPVFGRIFLHYAGILRSFDARTGAELGRWTAEGFPFQVTVSPDGRTVALALRERVIELRDAASGDLMARLEGHVHDCNSVAFHPTEPRIASGSRDQTTRVWNEETGEMIATFEEASPVIHVTWSPDGRRLASLLADGTIRVRTALTYPGF